MIDKIDELRVFVRSVETKNLTTAGQSLGISANQASRKIARLEEKLGVRLIARTTRNMSITEEGQKLYIHAQRILKELISIEENIRSNSKELKGVVRLAVPAICVRHGLLDKVSTAIETHPNLEIQVYIGEPAPDPIAAGYDISVYVGKIEDSSHIYYNLGAITPILAASSEYVTKYGVPETPEQLKSHQCIRIVRNGQIPTSWILIDPDNNYHEVAISGQFLTEDTRTAVDAVSAGLGIGRMSHYLLAKGIQSEALVQILPRYTLPRQIISALVPANCHRNSRISYTIELLRQVITQSSHQHT